MEKIDIIEKDEAKPVVPKKERICPEFMTKYEKCRLIGTRALQISRNAPVMVDIGKGKLA